MKDTQFILQPETITFKIVGTPRWGVQNEVFQDAFPGVSTRDRGNEALQYALPGVSPCGRGARFFKTPFRASLRVVG